MIFLGVDPGKKGGLAFIDENSQPLSAYKMPITKNVIGEEIVDQAAIVAIGNSFSVDYVIFEEPFIRGMDSYKSIGTIISNYTRVRDALLLCCQKILEVSPNEWQKNLLAYRPRQHKSKTKVDARAFCVSMNFPIETRKLRTGPNKGEETWDDGISDAYCIAEYGRRVIEYKNSFME